MSPPRGGMDIVALPRAPIGLAMGWTLLVNSVSESLAPAWENLPAEQNHPLCKRLGHPKPPTGSFARILAIPKPPAGPVSERSAFRERLAVDSSLFASWSLVSQHQGEGRRHSFVFDTGLFASWSLVSRRQGKGVVVLSSPIQAYSRHGLSSVGVKAKASSFAPPHDSASFLGLFYCQFLIATYKHISRCGYLVILSSASLSAGSHRAA